MFSPDLRNYSRFSHIFIDACQRTAASIREEFGLSLFGFDAILPNSSPSSANSDTSASTRIQNISDSNKAGSEEDMKSAEAPKIVVIDVNYFPSYKEVKDFPYRLKKYLHSRMLVK